MSVSLVKGQKIDLTKGNAGLRKVVFALGWDLNRYDGDAEFDLEVKDRGSILQKVALH